MYNPKKLEIAQCNKCGLKDLKSNFPEREFEDDHFENYCPKCKTNDLWCEYIGNNKYYLKRQCEKDLSKVKLTIAIKDKRINNLNKIYDNYLLPEFDKQQIFESITDYIVHNSKLKNKLEEIKLYLIEK